LDLRNTPGTAETALETSKHLRHRSGAFYTALSVFQTLKRSKRRPVTIFTCQLALLNTTAG
jgi:hypothetical protein